MMRLMVLALCAVALSGCEYQRASVARDAQTRLVGFSREQVLACMGPPASRATEGATEVWAYNSGDGGPGPGAVAVPFGGFTYLAPVGGQQRGCQVHVQMAGGIVARVNYLGNTGNWDTKGEQCAYAVEPCMK